MRDGASHFVKNYTIQISENGQGKYIICIQFLKNWSVKMQNSSINNAIYFIYHNFDFLKQIKQIKLQMKSHHFLSRIPMGENCQ